MSKQAVRPEALVDFLEGLKDPSVTYNFVSASGAQNGWVRAWLIGDQFLVHHTDNATDTVEVVDVADVPREKSLGCYVLPDRADFSGTDAEYAAAQIETFGLGEIPDEPEDTSDGQFAVLVVHNYYHGRCPKEVEARIATLDGDRHMEFDTIEEARQWIAEFNDETYHTEHAEIGRPVCKIVEA